MSCLNIFRSSFWRIASIFYLSGRIDLFCHRMAITIKKKLNMNLAYCNHITGGDSEKVLDSPKTNRTPDHGGASFAEMFDELVNRVAERGLTPVGFQTANHADLKVDDFKTRRKDRYSCFVSRDTYSAGRGFHRSRADFYSSVYRDDRLVAVMDRATVTEKQKDEAGPIIDHNDYIVLEGL